MYTQTHVLLSSIEHIELQPEDRVVSRKEKQPLINLPPLNSQLAPAADIKIVHFVIVNYNNTYYPGQVRQIRKDELYVFCMNKIGRNKFTWPKPEDLCWYRLCDIADSITEPVQSNSRYSEFSSEVWAKLDNS